MTIERYKLPSGDLASRRLAITERNHIEQLLKSSAILKLDLKDVKSLSESYSDEIFGVLVVKHGVEYVLGKLKIENASTSILKSIARVIQRRNHELQNTTKNVVPLAKNFNQGWATC